MSQRRRGRLINVIPANALCERFSQLKRAVPPSRHDDDDNNGSLKRERVISTPADLVFWPTGPAILLVSTASQVRTGICRSSRGLGGTFFRTYDGCRLESSVYHLSFMVFGAVDAQTLARAGGLV